MNVLSIVAPVQITPSAGEENWPGNVAHRVAAELGTRRFGDRELSTRGPREVFAGAVQAVPFIITENSLGSGVVVDANPNTLEGRVVTNHHVVASPFRDKEGSPFVVLVFYDALLADEQFENDRVANCLLTQTASTWCQTFRRVVRIGYVVAIDPGRDLALVSSVSTPPGIRPIPPADLGDIRPGDEVSVIGHPLGLLWTLTTGTVSAVRSNYRVANSPSSPKVAVVQTQAPVHPGNSGGQLLSRDGRLIGVVVGSSSLPMGTDTGKTMNIAAAGLNFAIAVNEVRHFVVSQGKSP
jgi:S1-C subfamily serine protease